MAATTQHCPSCGRPQSFAHVYDVRGFRIGKCTACGLGATHLPPGFDPASIYTEDYFEGGHDDGYLAYGSSAGTLRREFRSALRALRKHVPSPARGRRPRLLELGCAYGFFLEAAREHFEVVGIEMSAHAAARARSLGLDVRTGTIDETLRETDGPFDAAVMLDVVEHLVDPSAVIERMASALVPGGVLMLTTGDWSSWLAQRMGARWRLMTPPQHLFFFDAKTLGTMLRHAGFEVVSVDHPWKSVPVSLGAYQAARMLGLGSGTGSSLLEALKSLPLGIPVNLFDAMRVLAVRR